MTLRTPPRALPPPSAHSPPASLDCVLLPSIVSPRRRSLTLTTTPRWAEESSEYSLKFRQQPRVTRITGEGEKGQSGWSGRWRTRPTSSLTSSASAHVQGTDWDSSLDLVLPAERRPIDPPPIIQLHVVHRPSPPPGLSEAGSKANAAQDVDMDGSGPTAEQKGKGREVTPPPMATKEGGEALEDEILEGTQYLQK